MQEPPGFVWVVFLLSVHGYALTVFILTKKKNNLYCTNCTADVLKILIV